MTIRSALAAALLAALATGPVHAQDYPNRPITLVVPFSAGGGADNSMRILTRILSQRLGQTVMIDNKAGAAGIVGTEFVANAKPDGYTLLFGSSGPMATYVSLYKKLSYDPVKSFVPIRASASNPYVMVVNASAPFKTLPQLIDYAKKNPEKINFGSIGSGTSNHLAGELLQSLAGIKMTHVPYKVSASQITDLLGGVIDVSFEFPSGIRPHLESGKLIPIAMTSDARMKNFPNVPTFSELGYPEMKIAAWSSILAPAGTPQEIVEKLDVAIAEALKDPAMIDYYGIGDSVILDIDHKQFPAFQASEIVKAKMLIDRSGAKAD